MNLTADQLAFIRVHGITRCPPGPEFRVLWGGGGRHRGTRELSDAGELESAGQLRIRSMLDPAFRESDFLAGRSRRRGG